MTQQRLHNHMVVDWDEAEPMEDEEGENEPDSLRMRLFKKFTGWIGVKT